MSGRRRDPTDINYSSISFNNKSRSPRIRPQYNFYEDGAGGESYATLHLQRQTELDKLHNKRRHLISEMTRNSPRRHSNQRRHLTKYKRLDFKDDDTWKHESWAKNNSVKKCLEDFSKAENMQIFERADESSEDGIGCRTGMSDYNKNVSDFSVVYNSEIKQNAANNLLGFEKIPIYEKVDDANVTSNAKTEHYVQRDDLEVLNKDYSTLHRYVINRNNANDYIYNNYNNSILKQDYNHDDLIQKLIYERDIYKRYFTEVDDEYKILNDSYSRLAKDCDQFRFKNTELLKKLSNLTEELNNNDFNHIHATKLESELEKLRLDLEKARSARKTPTKKKVQDKTPEKIILSENKDLRQSLDDVKTELTKAKNLANSAKKSHQKDRREIEKLSKTFEEKSKETEDLINRLKNEIKEHEKDTRKLNRDKVKLRSEIKEKEQLLDDTEKKDKHNDVDINKLKTQLREKNNA